MADRYRTSEPHVLAELIADARAEINYLGRADYLDSSKATATQLGDHVGFLHKDTSEPSTAVLIGQIQHTGTWLNPEGNWGRPNIPTQFPIPVTKSQIRFPIGPVPTGIDNAFDVVYSGKDYENAVMNVNKLQAAAFNIYRKSLKKPEMRSPLIKHTPLLVLGHKLFTERRRLAAGHASDGDEESDSDGDDEDTDSEVSSDSDAYIAGSQLSEFHIKGYPACEQWKEEAEVVRRTHKLCPMVAYDEYARPIRPSDYQSKLQGAIVIATINFSAYNIRSNTFAFTADVQEIRVLARRLPNPRSTQKRKFDDILAALEAHKRAKKSAA